MSRSWEHRGRLRFIFRAASHEHRTAQADEAAQVKPQHVSS